MEDEQEPFWRRKVLSQMTTAEWESLCDGCGKCCLHKLEDEDTGEVVYTRVACRLLNMETLRCRHYEGRHAIVPECVRLAPSTIPPWMPDTCAYRLLSEGEALPEWHPLITGDPESTRRAGIAIQGRVISEANLVGDMDDADWDAFLL